MPIICIGPVCIPVTALVPILIYLARPVWVRLPPAWQRSFITNWNALQARLQASVWDRIGWHAKPKAAPKSAATAGIPAAGDTASAAADLRRGMGSVVGLHSDEDWEAALSLSKEGVAVVVDFTATWCGPCQRIAPFFAKLAGTYPTQCLFVKVDVDELEEVSQNAGVAAMPTFQVYANGALADTCTGASEAKLEAMVEKAAKKAA